MCGSGNYPAAQERLKKTCDSGERQPASEYVPTAAGSGVTLAFIETKPLVLPQTSMSPSFFEESFAPLFTLALSNAPMMIEPLKPAEASILAVE